jgi:hypothetical protein
MQEGEQIFIFATHAGWYDLSNAPWYIELFKQGKTVAV